MKVRTSDLYFSAYLMAKGIALHAMSIQTSGSRHKIIFTFSSNEELNSLISAFQNGKALINPIEYKKSILHLKDMMYDRLRNNREERRYDYNQRRDRGHQAVK